MPDKITEGKIISVVNQLQVVKDYLKTIDVNSETKPDYLILLDNEKLIYIVDVGSSDGFHLSKKFSFQLEPATMKILNPDGN